MKNLHPRITPASAARPELRLAPLALALSLQLAGPAAIAGPGAHGPNGEHLEEKSAGTAAAVATAARLEAHTEQFELIATLYDSELSILVDRYASNEPVLGAKLEIEVGGVKALATFHADHGDYASDDPKLLELLKTPGQHALVFTLTAGADSDLLDGVLVTSAGATLAAHDHGPGGTAAHDDDDDHDHRQGLLAGWRGWAAGSVAALALLGGAWLWRSRRTAAGANRIGRPA